MAAFIRYFVLPTISAVIAGLFVAWLFNAQPSATLSASVDWIEIPNRNYDNGRESEVTNSLSTIGTAYGVPNLLSVFEQTRFDSTLAICHIQIKNADNVRSSTIEIVMNGVYASFIRYPIGGSESVTKLSTQSSPISLGYIDPGSTVDVYILARSTIRLPDSISILQDGRLVHLKNLKYQEWADPFGIIDLTLSYPFWIFMIVFVGGVSLILLVGVIVASAVLRDNFAYQYKFLTSSDLKRVVRFAEYIRERQARSEKDLALTEPKDKIDP